MPIEAPRLPSLVHHGQDDLRAVRRCRAHAGVAQPTIGTSPARLQLWL